ncbi:MAG: excinuclease ABC subunit UvrA [Pseudomonadota bacterium]
MARDRIAVRGARQNNLRNVDIDLPLGELIVVTGVSGSGKSSLAFDTIYAEGQRRYVETFSPYARQFLDRMDKPAVDRIDGIPPAIAIDQTNPVRTSRSTVGTMTELNDHLKLLFARAADLYCDVNGELVREDHPQSIWDAVLERWPGRRVAITFEAAIPENFSADEIERFLAQQGYTRILKRRDDALQVVQDRLRLDPDRYERAIEAIEEALSRGDGHVAIVDLDAEEDAQATARFSSRLHCASCDLEFSPATPSMFSFNSPLGACETCRGFGRVMGIDRALVVPDPRLSLEDGAIKPLQGKSYSDLQTRLLRRARKAGISVNTPWEDLDADDQAWVFDGEGSVSKGLWPGVTAFFDWLESKAYKMHVRVMLSRYRSYETCPACNGARLKPAGLRWRLGDKAATDAAGATREGAPPGLNMHELMLLPITRLAAFFDAWRPPAAVAEAAELLLEEIRGRISFLAETGLGYLTLDRQSRTLSGGEVQRINLTTALGTSLVNTLFVLDEPSIGLHPRDVSRINAVLTRLRDAGNTLIVVEHDPQIMHVADRIVDIGPGPGERGGQIVFNGTIKGLARRRSGTGAYLTGKRRVADCRQRRELDAARGSVGVRGARAHNLQDIDVDFPLGGLVCVTGVSGSGKSTLVGDVLYPALRRHFGGGGDLPGAHDTLVNPDAIENVVYVDQAQIGKTARSNPASFVGAFDAIRKQFCEQPLAVERGYKPGKFSFNSGDGRCPHCGGTGYEHVEMQFLSDVYLRCPVCDGKRFRDEILEVHVWPANDDGPSKSIADVLDMTVTEALAFFAETPAVSRSLQPLVDVGLDYLRLGQPVPTLSGGEAQRLKLAKHLVEAQSKRFGKGKLFLFDEPTTGLHFSDIERLLGAFDKLIDEGHSIVVIEHNLDVIDASDWIVDLGPEGGEGGGKLGYAGPVEGLIDAKDNHTGIALGRYRKTQDPMQMAAETAAEYLPAKRERAARAIEIRHAREHNLRDVDVSIPRDTFTVITGVSGSGKSTVAFDILFNEGQRRYLESLNAYARQFVQPASRPDVDAVLGIPPTVAIEQRTSRGGRKSTVGTMTEVYHFLRLLFVKLGTAHCPDCNVPIEPQTPEQISALLQKRHKGCDITLLAPLVIGRKGYYTDLAAWAGRKGFETLRVDGELTPVDPWPRLDRFVEHNIELPVATMRIDARKEQALNAALSDALDFGKGNVIVNADGDDTLYSTVRACPSCARSFPELDPRLFSYNSPRGWCPSCSGTGIDSDEEEDDTQWWRSTASESEETCGTCNGARLNEEALAVTFRDQNIASYADMPVSDALAWVTTLNLKGRDAEVARDIIAELEGRLGFLERVGLGYLTLSRSAPTLSGGEAQRIRLAAQLGSNLRGVCYILDEPTIGLHARDNAKLLGTLQALQKSGNTVVVVEHDEDTIRGAQHIIDIGPGAGTRGGRIVAEGNLRRIERASESLTGRMLREPLQHPVVETPRDVNPRRRSAPALAVKQATLNNLKRVSARLPLGALVAVTGVSGSGKSSLIRGVVETNVARLVSAGRRRGRKQAPLVGCQALEGWESISRVLEVDQTPIGKTPRSCPATYVGFWDDIRKLFAQTPEARMRGYTASRFSFNTKEGRCPECDGQGMRRIEMSFMPDVQVPCEACGGKRFTPDTLGIRYRGQSIGDILQMAVSDAVEFFAAHPKIHHALKLLDAVGLGYLTLGQPSPTLSGGEAQRIKLVSELAKARPDPARPVLEAVDNPQHTLYVLDEPTIGLHMADVEKLIRVLHRLVDAGHSVLIIEHNLDIIAEADWIIDMGPEGGAAGGRIVAQGKPKQLAELNDVSHTTAALRAFFDRDRRNLDTQ